MATQPQHHFTFWEYLNLERKADCRSEFHAGQIIAMSGGTEPHSRLSARITALLSLRLQQCRVYDSNLKLFIPQFSKGVYPDCMVLCGEPQFWNDQRDVILNPNLVVEVLSHSTEKYDRGDKSWYFRSIPLLQDILLVSQDQIFVEHSTKQDDGAWRVTQHSSEKESIRLFTAELSLEEIYNGIVAV